MKFSRITITCVAMLLGLYAEAPFAQTFTRIDTSIITRDGGRSIGASWGDYDNDGDDDLFVSNGGPGSNFKNFLYRNEGAGRFTKITAGLIVTEASTPGSYGACWGDYDNDGKLDLFVPSPGMKNRLYHNEGNGVFSKVTTGVIVGSVLYSDGGSWVDYDRDGDLDLFVVNSAPVRILVLAPNSLYRNDGNGVFTEITQGLIVTERLYSENGNWADYDNDGDMDLFVVNSGDSRTPVSHRLYLNNGNGVLDRVPSSEVMNYIRDCWSASWGDYDNDGYLDLFVAAYFGPNLLFHNRHNGAFEHVTAGSVATASGPHFGSSWGDFDNDGDLDLFVTTDSPSGNLLYNNDGRGNFTQVTGQTLANDRAQACTTSDYDNDGDLDILTVSGGNFGPVENHLYSNNGNGNSWINIKCVGTVSNRTAIGTRIRAKARIGGAAVWQIREIAQQTGFAGHNSLRVHFGFGNATVIDSLVIRWPSKMTEVYTNVAVKQFFTATEGGRLTAVEARNTSQPVTFSLSQNYPNPFNPSTTIRYALPKSQFVTLKIFNLAGQELATLVNQQQVAGEHTVSWNAEKFPSGVYVYRLQVEEFSETKKMILLR